MERAAVGFEWDIRPLFRDEDIRAMSFAFDLASYSDVREHAEDIYDRLSDRTMPCDSPWPDEQIERFRRWLDGGRLP